MEINYNASYTLKFLILSTSKVRVFTPLIVKMPTVRLGAKGISAKPRFDYNSCSYTSTNTFLSFKFTLAFFFVLIAVLPKCFKLNMSKKCVEDHRTER